MLYKPNFCCNCGEKIERADWNLLTSRRFCPACAEENRRHENVPRAAVAAGVLGLVFGLGSLFGGSGERAAPVQTLVSSPVGGVEPTRDPKPRTAQAELSPPTPAPSAQAVAASSPPAKAIAARTYYCGALTKKGTPCSRKVKLENTRCFQHEGKPAAASVD